MTPTSPPSEPVQSAAASESGATAPIVVSAGARAILDAAAATFAKASFDSVSIADIASQAGVCKANIFHHFKSKEALYLEVMREACKGHAEFAEALLADPTLSSVDKLRRLIEYDFRTLFGNEERSHLILREILDTGCRTGRTLVEPVFLRNFTAVVGLIRQGQQRAEFTTDVDPAVLAMMVGGAAMMLFQNRCSDGLLAGVDGSADPMACANTVFRTVLGGIAARGSSPATPSRLREIP
ncbi:MAG: TetR/AcrR family transcriptional regulator [Nevskia sp.]|nr:TetR/AcrR family transcriptional regulator [Nevskia sp.]